MGEQDSKSNIELQEILAEVAKIIVAPPKEEWEMTKHDLSKLAGINTGRAKYYLAKYYTQGLLERRMVSVDDVRMYAYSPQGGDVAAWKDFIKAIQES